jgi:hypothetical protein
MRSNKLNFIDDRINELYYRRALKKPGLQALDDLHCSFKRGNSAAYLRCAQLVLAHKKDVSKGLAYLQGALVGLIQQQNTLGLIILKQILTEIQDLYYLTGSDLEIANLLHRSVYAITAITTVDHSVQTPTSRLDRLKQKLQKLFTLEAQLPKEPDRNAQLQIDSHNTLISVGFIPAIYYQWQSFSRLAKANTLPELTQLNHDRMTLLFAALFCLNHTTLQGSIRWESTRELLFAMPTVLAYIEQQTQSDVITHAETAIYYLSLIEKHYQLPPAQITQPSVSIINTISNMPSAIQDYVLEPLGVFLGLSKSFEQSIAMTNAVVVTALPSQELPPPAVNPFAHDGMTYAHIPVFPQCNAFLTEATMRTASAPELIDFAPHITHAAISETVASVYPNLAEDNSTQLYTSSVLNTDYLRLGHVQQESVTLVSVAISGPKASAPMIHQLLQKPNLGQLNLQTARTITDADVSKAILELDNECEVSSIDSVSQAPLSKKTSNSNDNQMNRFFSGQKNAGQAVNQAQANKSKPLVMML